MKFLSAKSKSQKQAIEYLDTPLRGTQSSQGKTKANACKLDVRGWKRRIFKECSSPWLP
jgi:hypothetical protein